MTDRFEKLDLSGVESGSFQKSRVYTFDLIIQERTGLGAMCGGEQVRPRLGE